MEMQFDRISVPYLQKLAGQRRTQEQTLEVRIPEGMPDIGRVLGAWGQVIVRSKEWGSGAMSLSCGVMAWVLYIAEDDESVQSVEAWLPFSAKWELPDTRYDGKILASCLLKGVDARSTSARKLMVRANLEALGDAWQQTQTQVAVPGAVPEDVAMLTACYPVLLPKEVGEKAFLMDERLPWPANMPKPEKLLYYTLSPEILDKKVMAGKVVFRGMGMLHLVYRASDGRLYTWDSEIPFSQYGDLEGEYDADPVLAVRPCVTSLDLTLDENGELLLKAGLLGQYILWDHVLITVAEDVYSPRREISLTVEELLLPAVLDQISQSVQAESSFQIDAKQILDVIFYPQLAELERLDGSVEVILPGQIQMLYYDDADQLRSAVAPWEGSWNLPMAENADVNVWVSPAGKLQFAQNSGTVRGDLCAEAVVTAGQGISMITRMELGEQKKPDPNRPGLILCRAGKRRLWDVAKQCGSTVEAIKQANNLDGEPESNAVLLIPVT